MGHHNISCWYIRSITYATCSSISDCAVLIVECCASYVNIDIFIEGIIYWLLFKSRTMTFFCKNQCLIFLFVGLFKHKIKTNKQTKNRLQVLIYLSVLWVQGFIWPLLKKSKLSTTSQSFKSMQVLMKNMKMPICSFKCAFNKPGQSE